MSITERADEFFRRVDAIAREMKLEVEFTTHSSGYGWMAYDVAAIEIVSTDTNEYLDMETSKTFGGKVLATI